MSSLADDGGNVWFAGHLVAAKAHNLLSLLRDTADKSKDVSIIQIMKLIYSHPTVPFNMIIKTISQVSPTGADDFIDCTLKHAGVKSWLDLAKQACSKVPFGRLLKDLFHQLYICRYAFINTRFQSPEHDCN